MPVDTNLVRDVVIVIPGIMGSALEHMERGPIWSLEAGSLVNAIKTLGGSLQSLALPIGIGDEAPPGNRIRATHLLPSLHVIPGLWSPITGYDGTLEFLRSTRFQMIEPDPRDPDRIPNLISFPYDWRLSNRYNARLLKVVAEDALARWREQPGMEESRLVLVCHSMGGLIARWFLEQEGGAAFTRTLITIGTPHRGALKALNTLSNGLEPSLGPFHLHLTEFARSLPSLHQLLPTYDCLDLGTDVPRRSLHGLDLPDVSRAMQDDALAFHATLDASPEPAYAFHKVVGIRQPTLTTAAWSHGRLIASEEIDGSSQGGDGTVPRLASQPVQGRNREVLEVANQHGELQGTRSALDLIDGLLTREDVIWQSTAPSTIGVSMAELWSPEDRPRLRVHDEGDDRLHVTVFDERLQQMGPATVVGKDGWATLGPLPAGGYHARVSGAIAGGPAPVTHPFLVWNGALA